MAATNCDITPPCILFLRGSREACGFSFAACRLGHHFVLHCSSYLRLAANTICVGRSDGPDSGPMARRTCAYCAASSKSLIAQCLRFLLWMWPFAPRQFFWFLSQSPV